MDDDDANCEREVSAFRAYNLRTLFSFASRRNFIVCLCFALGNYEVKHQDGEARHLKLNKGIE